MSFKSFLVADDVVKVEVWDVVDKGTLKIRLFVVSTQCLGTQCMSRLQ